MSDHEDAWDVPTKPPPQDDPPPRDGCLTAIMVLVGIILLLPGACAIIIGGLGGSPRFDFGVGAFFVGLIGISLITLALRKQR